MNVTLPPLPYALDALEPHISKRTLAAHYGHHHAAYVEKTRSLVQRTPLQSASLEEIVRAGAGQTDGSLFKAAAQAWNHAFYWQCMRPGGGGEASGAVAPLIEESFGSQTAFRKEFVTTAGDQFGSGWVWLLKEGTALSITSTPNQDNPLMEGKTAILGVDVWEHAYYLKYQNRRADYLGAWWNVVNWAEVNKGL